LFASVTAFEAVGASHIVTRHTVLISLIRISLDQKRQITVERDGFEYHFEKGVSAWND
jgi:hypothetical protein